MKRKLAGSNAGLSRQKDFFKPQPTTRIGHKILQLVRAAFRPAWTKGWGQEQREMCVAEAYQEAYQALWTVPPEDDIVKVIVNHIANKLKNDEAREGVHTPLFFVAADGKEIPIPDFEAKFSDIEQDYIDQVDRNRIASQPVPEKAKKYQLTLEELEFLNRYYDDTTDGTPAVRKRFERLLKKEKAYLTYYGAFMWLQLEQARLKRLEMSQKAAADTGGGKG